MGPRRGPTPDRATLSRPRHRTGGVSLAHPHGGEELNVSYPPVRDGSISVDEAGTADPAGVAPGDLNWNVLYERRYAFEWLDGNPAWDRVTCDALAYVNAGLPSGSPNTPVTDSAAGCGGPAAARRRCVPGVGRERDPVAGRGSV